MQDCTGPFFFQTHLKSTLFSLPPFVFSVQLLLYPNLECSHLIYQVPAGNRWPDQNIEWEGVLVKGLFLRYKQTGGKVKVVEEAPGSGTGGKPVLPLCLNGQTGRRATQELVLSKGT